MRHNKAVNHLGRKSGHRKALLANMACSLVLHKRITTTTAKAKALKPYLEPLITKSKEDTTHNRRVVFSYLKNKEAVSEIFRTIAPKIADRPGGYLRILKVGNRQGDAAEMSLIEFVDFNEAALASGKKEAKKSTRRSRAKKAEAPAETPAEAPAEEAPKAEEAKAE
ncbi:MAG: 50S ribosomal protein L17 [Bacteroidales bacterium]|nr:50S ribosomal protein L17 [Bacteroidales bacterium]MCR5245324.1 50S ribosomal protein L17 [Bacteroidales bacterium]